MSVFVVMRNRSSRKRGLIPFTDDDMCLVEWPTVEHAREALKDHYAASVWGATAFDFETGESEDL